jgi:hypothetical protein
MIVYLWGRKTPGGQMNFLGLFDFTVSAFSNLNDAFTVFFFVASALPSGSHWHFFYFNFLSVLILFPIFPSLFLGTISSLGYVGFFNVFGKEFVA